MQKFLQILNAYIGRRSLAFLAHLVNKHERGKFGQLQSFLLLLYCVAELGKSRGYHFIGGNILYEYINIWETYCRGNVERKQENQPSGPGFGGDGWAYCLPFIQALAASRAWRPGPR